MNEDRFWAVLDEIRKNVKDLCVRTSVLESSLNNHLEGQEKKFNKTIVIISAVIGIIGLVAAFK